MAATKKIIQQCSLIKKIKEKIPKTAQKVKFTKFYKKNGNLKERKKQNHYKVYKKQKNINKLQLPYYTRKINEIQQKIKLI